LGRTDDDLFKTLYSNSSNSVRLVQKPTDVEESEEVVGAA